MNTKVTSITTALLIAITILALLFGQAANAPSVAAQSETDDASNQLFLPAISSNAPQTVSQSTLNEQTDTQVVAAAPSPTGATIASDLPDYPPGATVTLTGAGWAASESVHIFVNDDSSQSWSHNSNPDPSADSNGAFTYQFQLPTYFVANYSVIATGSAGSGTASTTFTDANSSASLDQCANDPAPSPSTDGCSASATDWVNGNLGASKSLYLEGDSIPYRLSFDNLSLTSHTVTIEWDTTKSSTHALDYLTTFNQTVATANPCLGVSGCGSPTTFPIPVDPQVAGAGVTPVAGNFTLYGGTITAVSVYSYADGTGFTGDKSARITITFTASQANPVLAWGGHISTRADWGANNSAVTIPGSPYHTRLIDLDGSGGNQDRSLSADAVIFPGSITIIKDATPNGSTAFAFTASPSPLANFSLVDDGTSANTKTFSNIIDFNTYNVAETVPSDWSLTGIVCTVTSPNGGSQTVSSPSVTINLKEGENVTCTYSNQQQVSKLSITKTPDKTDVCNGSNTQVTYTYGVKNEGDVALTGTVVDDNGTPGNTADDVTVGSFTNLAPGASATLTKSFTVNGTTTNTAKATGTSAGGQTATATATATVTGHVCAISVTKTPRQTHVCNGSSVTYDYTVTNNSDKFSWSGSLGDNKLGVVAASIALAPGQSASFSASGVINGAVTNTATASGTFDDPASSTASASASATVTGHNCTISITKTPNVNSVCNDANTSVTYTYVVKNEGDFFNVSGAVSDNVLGNVGSFGPLAPGASATLTKVGTVNATTTNTATATGTFDDANSTSASTSASATVTGHNCAISITKTPSVKDVCNNAGVQVTYNYVVKNEGDTFPASGTVVDDNGTPGNAADDVAVGAFGPLAPGASATLTKAFTVNGTTTNTATASGTSGGASVSATASATVTGHTCAISITKTPDKTDVCNGSNTQVTYTYVVKNTGDFFSASGSVSDNVLGSVGSFGPLAPGDSATLTKVGTVNGTTTNTATASGTSGGANISATASATVTGHNCTISITKTPSVNSVCNNTNTQVTYTYVVKNTGDLFNVSGAVSDNVLGSIGNFGPLAPGAIATLTKVGMANGTTTNTATATGIFDDVSSTSASATASATVNGQMCRIIIKKITKPTGALTSFSFDATGYADFSLSDGQTNSQDLNPGTYTVKELVPLGWVLTGIGGSTDANTPYNCTVTGSGGSTGVGDLNTQTVTINLKVGDTVMCTFENTGQGVTRTQGFWATHPQLANIAWFGGTAFGHTFPGVATTSGIGDNLICGKPLDTLGKVMGAFWSDIAKKSTGAKRSALDQARMQLLQQLIAAELNASAFGSVPSSGSFAAWETALCGTNTSAIKTAQQQAASFNTAGDSGTFTPGTSADSKYARSIATIKFWDTIPPMVTTASVIADEETDADAGNQMVFLPLVAQR